MDENSDDEYDYSGRYDSDLELDKESTSNNEHKLPLIPTGYTSISEAIQNFTAVFESRYGVEHAPFYEGSLLDAFGQAFESPGGIEYRRPLVIYLHNDNSVSAHIFAQNVFCSKEVSNLLRCQYIVWPWDVSQAQNKQNFLDWVDLASINGNMESRSAIADSIKYVTTDKYPLIIILVKKRGVLTRMDTINGQEGVATAVQKLMAGIDAYQSIRDKDSHEERSRLEREEFRRNQVEEYERGLAADRAKQEELKLQQETKIKEETKRLLDEEEKRKRAKALASTLPVEPAPDNPNAVTIRLRCPDGTQRVRRFLTEDSVEMLIIYAETVGYDSSRYRFWTSDMPRKDVSTLNTSKSFSELGWPRREQITIEEV